MAGTIFEEGAMNKTVLNRRLERLESRHAQAAHYDQQQTESDAQALVRQAMVGLSEDELRLLIAGHEAFQQGTELTAEQSAAMETYQAAVAREFQMAGFASWAAFDRRHEGA